MAWEIEHVKHTAFLQKFNGADRKATYQLCPLVQVQRGDFIALEPLPALTPSTRLGDLFGFDEVQFIDPVVVSHTATAGPLNLTSFGQQTGVRTSLESKS